MPASPRRSAQFSILQWSILSNRRLDDFDCRRSQAGSAAGGETLFHGTSLAISDVPLHPFDQVMAATARRKVLDHFLVPVVVVELVEPQGQESDARPLAI